MNPDLRALCLSEEISSDIRLALSSAKLIFEDEEILRLRLEGQQRNKRKEH